MTIRQTSSSLATLVTLTIISYTNTNCNREPSWNPVVLTDTQYCAAACEHIGSKDGGLNCSEGQPIEMKPDACAFNDAGVIIEDDISCVSCKKFCEDSQNQGVPLKPRCIVNITSCDQIDMCQEGNNR